MSALDKAGRLAAEKIKRAKEQRESVARLDPRFPHRIAPLDLRFLGVTLLQGPTL